MNYRHAFHAGNFADLVKHAVLLDILAAMTGDGPPLTVIDTHAGAGMYDLDGEAARRTGEAALGVRRLRGQTPAPAAFAPLLAAVRQANASETLRYYPGSPVLIAKAMRRGDRYLACELHPEDHAVLSSVLGSDTRCEVLHGDGWRNARARLPPAPAACLLLLDPPFEQGDDMAQAVALAAEALAHNRPTVVAIWLPIKDLAGYDAFLCDLEDAVGAAPILAIQVRLRPLTDPMKLNGCALVVVNAPPGLQASASVIAQWVAAAAGGPGALGRADWLGR